MHMFDQILIPNSGAFQSNEVYLAAFFRLVNPECKIIRSKDYERYIEYSSHISPPERYILIDNPSFNLYYFWKDYGRMLCPSDKAYEWVENNFILKLKDGDVLDRSICALNKSDNDTLTSDNVAFMRAVNVVNIIMSGWIKTATDVSEWINSHNHSSMEELI